MLSPLAHGESGPSDAAVSFLIDVARDRIDLNEDTAIAEGTTSEKEKIIRSQLKRLSSIVEVGELRALEEKVDGDLAGVLVSRVVDYDPSQVQVFAIAMLKRDDRWQPAPVLASFENTGITYLPGLSTSSKALENWMLTQRTIYLTRLREDVQADLLDDIRSAGSLDQLRNNSPEEIVNQFIEACRAKNLPGALVYLGGLETKLPKNWNQILQFVSSNIRGSSETNESWRQLTSSIGARAVIDTDSFDDGAIVSIGDYSPFESTPGQPAVTIFHFPLDRSDEDTWRLRLPSWLLDGDLPDEADPSDESLVEAFPRKLIKKQKPLSFSDPAALMESFQQALCSPDFERTLPHIALPDSGDALPVIERASRLWRDYRGRESQAPLLLDVRQENDQACALVSLFDDRNPQIRRTLIKPIYLQRKDGHWTIPAIRIDDDDIAPGLTKWAEESSALSEADWIARLGLTATLGGIPADSAPTEAEARDAATAWLSALQSRNPRAILRAVAAFDDELGIKNLFGSIGHELQSGNQSEILKIHRNGRWAAVSTRAISTEKSNDGYYLLFPIVSTQAGPRVLAEALLYHAADSRSLGYLNSVNWKRLEDRLPEAAVTELQEIHKAHSALAEAP